MGGFRFSLVRFWSRRSDGCAGELEKGLDSYLKAADLAFFAANEIKRDTVFHGGSFERVKRTRRHQRLEAWPAERAWQRGTFHGGAEFCIGYGDGMVRSQCPAQEGAEAPVRAGDRWWVTVAYFF
ncbi:hypothetical protein NL676_026767 [Syzygium grande]|nr:hypothetical protein NL676_026767 [Syzygium grande]